jgi:hypothetical protein
MAVIHMLSTQENEMCERNIGLAQGMQFERNQEITSRSVLEQYEHEGGKMPLTLSAVEMSIINEFRESCDGIAVLVEDYTTSRLVATIPAPEICFYL